MTATLDSLPAITKSTIYEALAAVMADVRAVGKDSFNKVQKFHFRGIDAVVNAANPALVKHGVIVVPELLEKEYGTVQVGNNRTQMAHCQVKVCYRFYGPDGSSIPVTVPGEAMDSGDKATPKAMSVAFRIALLQALSLPTDDPDPDATAYERSSAPKTDQQWRADMERRINEAGTAEELQALSEEMEAKKASGDCEDVHFDHLWNLGLAKYNQLSQPQETPTAPVEQRTDHAWLADIEKRIAATTTTHRLVELGNEVRAQKLAGRCEAVHEAHLIAVGRERMQAIAAEEPQAAPNAAPAPTSRQSVRGGGEPVDENEFEVRLKAAKTAAELEQLKTDVMAAFKAQKLGPTAGNSLLRSIKARAYELEEKA